MRGSAASWIIIGVVIIGLVVISVYLYGNRKSIYQSKSSPVTQQQPSDNSVSKSATPVARPVAVNSNNDTSDAAVQNDMDALDKDLSNIDSGLNDKQGDLSE